MKLTGWFNRVDGRVRCVLGKEENWPAARITRSGWSVMGPDGKDGPETGRQAEEICDRLLIKMGHDIDPDEVCQYGLFLMTKVPKNFKEHCENCEQCGAFQRQLDDEAVQRAVRTVHES